MLGYKLTSERKKVISVFLKTLYNKILFIYYRDRELVEAKADVLKTLVEHTDQSSEKRRAVVFYLDKGTGFLGKKEESFRI